MWFCWRSITTCARRRRTEFPHPSFRPSDSERRNLCFLISPFPDFSTALTSFVPVEMTKKKAACRRESSSRRQAALLKTLFNSYAVFTPRKLPMIADNCGIYAALLRIPPVKKPLFEQGDELAQSERHGHVFGQSQTHAAHGKRGRYVYFEQLAAFELLFAVFTGNAADSHTLYRKF